MTVPPDTRTADPLLSALDRDALRAVLEPPGRMLPAAAYLDPGVLAWERREVFDAGWVCLGRADALARPRSRLAFPLGSPDGEGPYGAASVLLVRGEDGVLRGFHNSCRHRGHELLPCATDAPAGRPRFLACPYHAWVYDLTGRLVRVPALDDGEPVAIGAAVPAARSLPADADRLGLIEVPVAEWQGFVLANLDGTAPPLAEWTSGLDELLAPYGLVDLTPAAIHRYTLRANWKLIVENYHECFHCPAIHPELCQVSSPDSGLDCGGPGQWHGGHMQLEPGVRTMSLDGTGSGPLLPGLTPGLRDRVYYLQLFPQLLLSPHPDYVMVHRLVPTGPDTTWVECQWLFPADRPAGFDPGYAVDFWDLTNRQDWTACESVQRGVSSPGYRPGPLSAWHERVVAGSIQHLARAYLDGAVGAVRTP
ncbi:aromatic ring-hydroxylating dioxygenase subunit alpha [Streptomyces sp. NPDC051940]|uniref:aromatic ring-hydroxylating oxygenase subunit alpha n=1 Tax=Streptomyces sp. NPDC051940 TaxID=3155675 RepID=UPI00342B9C78